MNAVARQSSSAAINELLGVFFSGRGIWANQLDCLDELPI
jgi:hypothetical protein